MRPVESFPGVKILLRSKSDNFKKYRFSQTSSCLYWKSVSYRFIKLSFSNYPYTLSFSKVEQCPSNLCWFVKSEIQWLIVPQKPPINSNLEQVRPLDFLTFMSQTTKATPGLTIFIQTALLLSSGTENTKI